MWTIIQTHLNACKRRALFCSLAEPRSIFILLKSKFWLAFASFFDWLCLNRIYRSGHISHKWNCFIAKNKFLKSTLKSNPWTYFTNLTLIYHIVLIIPLHSKQFISSTLTYQRWLWPSLSNGAIEVLQHNTIRTTYTWWEGTVSRKVLAAVPGREKSTVCRTLLLNRRLQILLMYV